MPDDLALNRTSSKRYESFDFFRGLALIYIFIDHISSGFFSKFTLQNLGLSDGAEMFVFISGFVSSIVYGKITLINGYFAAFKKVMKRTCVLYGANCVILLSHFLIITVFVKYLGLIPDVHDIELFPSFISNWKEIPEFLTFAYLPYIYAILPMYILFLLLLIPFLYGIRRVGLFVLTPFILLYVYTQLHPEFNLGLKKSPWAFNPFAWQILFFAGVTAGVYKEKILKIDFTSDRFAVCLSFGLIIPLIYRLFVAYLNRKNAFFHEFANFFPHPRIDWLKWKINLSVPRLVHFVFLAGTAYFFTLRFPDFFKTRFAKAVVLLGQHALSIFVSGVILDVFINCFFLTHPYFIASEFVLITIGGCLFFLVCGFQVLFNR